MTAPQSKTATVAKIFLAALALRWIYAAVMYVAMGNAGLLGVDSASYFEAAHVLASGLKAGTIEGWGWFGPNPFMMPLFRWLVGLHALVTTEHTAFAYVLTQGVFDAATCVVVYGMGNAIDSRLALPAAIASVINPTQIVMAGLVYPDTPFIFFVALVLYGALRWLRAPTWSAVALILLGLVCAAWIRILIMPFAAALAVFLLFAMWATGRLQRGHTVQQGGMLLLFAALIFPISLQNKTLYDFWALTPQGGQHLARWVVPLAWEMRDGTPWARGTEEMERRASLLPQPPNENSFQQSERYTAAAIEELKRMGPIPVAKAWVFGAAINLGTPGILLSPPILQMPRTGFYGTAGTNAIEKILNFLFRGDNVLYGWILLTGIGGVAVMRLLQLGGFFLLIRRRWAAALLLAGWCAFILCVNGPVASPKYRLPIEPALAMFTAAGWLLLTRRRLGDP